MLLHRGAQILLTSAATGSRRDERSAPTDIGDYDHVDADVKTRPGQGFGSVNGGGRKKTDMFSRRMLI